MREEHECSNQHNDVPLRVCRVCGYQVDTATSVVGTRPPKEGDFDICLNCGALSIFDESGGVRHPTLEERYALPDLGVDMIAEIKRRGRFKESGA